MSVQVCTVFTPRGAKEQWEFYLQLLSLQRRTVEKFGHRHVVVTDALLPSEFSVMRVPLDPDSLMRSMIIGVIRRLEVADDKTNLLFVDADCLIARTLDAAFGVEFDLGLTRREHETSPINNGAMYVPYGSEWRALEFFRRALADCGDHWGADQEAISRAAAPVGKEGTIAWRHGCRVRFLNMRDYGAVPKERSRPHRSNPFVIHFKGKEPKEWAAQYADSFIFSR